MSSSLTLLAGPDALRWIRERGAGRAGEFWELLSTGRLAERVQPL
ncbi:hypothetical protein [Hyalangium rubrum]|uniref:Uncharacterized protein n=1 Tax=Hyalangium rubrum TaxID=3103134 RepID=A0ABU5HBT2_9BACT|nr:hypothetical protein [Hyalangium sp. s54d21]MDY7230293.1 hypothetical protein [Hyalangium sp. s54d21]